MPKGLRGFRVKNRYVKQGNKYRNVQTVIDGIQFQSKAEAARYEYWSNLCHLGKILWFTRQVPFYLPGGVVYRADFLVVPMLGLPGHTDPIVEDVTGQMTNVKLNKLKQVKAIHGLDVVVVKRKGKQWTTEIVTGKISPIRKWTTSSGFTG
jgi:hypothetical protein